MKNFLFNTQFGTAIIIGAVFLFILVATLLTSYFSNPKRLRTNGKWQPAVDEAKAARMSNHTRGFSR